MMESQFHHWLLIDWKICGCFEFSGKNLATFFAIRYKPSNRRFFGYGLSSCDSDIALFWKWKLFNIDQTSNGDARCSPATQNLVWCIPKLFAWTPDRWCGSDWRVSTKSVWHAKIRCLWTESVLLPPIFSLLICSNYFIWANRKAVSKTITDFFVCSRYAYGMLMFTKYIAWIASQYPFGSAKRYNLTIYVNRGRDLLLNQSIFI